MDDPVSKLYDKEYPLDKEYSALVENCIAEDAENCIVPDPFDGIPIS